MTAYESKYRTLVNKPYHRAWHDTAGAPQAKAGFCTVAGVEKPHRATRSLYVRESKGGTCWVAACDQHVPPMADDDGEVS